MFLAGDEFGNSQNGNNNSYCQDNEISWLDWSLLEKNQELFEFFRFMIHYRHEHTVIRRKLPDAVCGMKPLHVYDTNANDWTAPQNFRTLSVSFAGYDRTKGYDDLVYISINPYWEDSVITLPNLHHRGAWYLSVNTYGDGQGRYTYPQGQEVRIDSTFIMRPRSVAVFTGRQLEFSGQD